jgi:protease I
MSKKLLAFVGDLYEDLELWYPKLRLEEAGFTWTLAGEEKKTYTSKHGYPAAAEAVVSEVKSADFAGVLIPGGFMPDKLRRNKDVLRLSKASSSPSSATAAGFPSPRKSSKANAPPAPRRSRMTWKTPARSGWTRPS